MAFTDRPVPVPGPGYVLVRVGSDGVCGSDKHFFKDGKASSEVMSKPFVMGHEFGGRIVSVGVGVDPDRVGQRVSVEPLVPDWTSREARMGRYNIDPAQRFYGVPGDDGGLAQFVSLPADNAFAIPDSVSDDAAAMVETISVSLNGIRKAGVGLGSRVLIAGGGPVGIFAAQLALLHGATAVALAEPNDKRRSFAAGLGCSVVRQLDDIDEQFDSFIECTGVASVRYDGFAKVLPGGRVVFIGVGDQDASIPMSSVIEREVTVHGVMRYAFTWPSVIAALAAGRIETDSLVSRRLPFSRAIEAWTVPLDAEVKTIIRPNDWEHTRA